MRKLLVAVIVVFALSFGCFAASLDDPVQPQTPTVKTEIQRGYQLAERMWGEYDSNWRIYAREVVNQYDRLEGKESTTDAFLTGFWLGVWAFHAYQSNPPNTWTENATGWKDIAKAYEKEFIKCRTSIDINEIEIGKLLEIDFQELRRMSNRNK
jgi:hypothetical protein